jgi:hypothetical protein
MVRAIALCAAAFALSACGAMRVQQAAKLHAQADAEAASCHQQFPTGPLKNHVALAECLNGVNSRYWPDPATRDLLDLFNAKRIAIATQMDQGKISEQDGNVLMAQARTDEVSAIERRNNARGIVAAQQATASAAQWNAVGNSLQRAGAALQTASPPPPQTTQCQWLGGQFICHSF